MQALIVEGCGDGDTALRKLFEIVPAAVFDDCPHLVFLRGILRVVSVLPKPRSDRKQTPEPITCEHVLAGRLKEVLASYAPKTLSVFLYFPDRKQVSPKLRAFIGHVRDVRPSRKSAHPS